MAIGIHRMSTVTGSEVWGSQLSTQIWGAQAEPPTKTVATQSVYREPGRPSETPIPDGLMRCNFGIYLLFVSLFGWLAVCQIPTHPVYDYDQTSLTYLLIKKKPGVNPTFVIRPINHLDSCCDFENSSYPQEVHENGSAVWNVGGWGQKRKPIHTRQTIRSPVRPAKWVVPQESETPFASLDFGYEWSSMTQRTV